MLIARLEGAAGPAFAELAAELERRNPGYSIAWEPALTCLEPAPRTRIVFVQGDASAAELEGERCAVELGDVLIVRPRQSLRLDPATGTLVFDVPEGPEAMIPCFLRPDHDPRIHDSPGGCATEEDAYRRIVLTWQEEHGPYPFHALNAHRVRMTDSLSHYHPIEDGFDELYLVQETRPGARVITSDKIARIEQPQTVGADEARRLLSEQPLAANDLVYFPRGTMHRGLGGVLAYVITIPGFVPGSEIGVDHHLRSINERLGLEGDGALPYHAATSDGPVIR